MSTMETKLEVKDAELEGKIEAVHVTVKSISEKLDGIDKQVRFTNGKVRSHQVWIAGIVGGAVVFMFALSFFRDSLLSMVAKSVEKQLTEDYQITIKP